MQAQGNEIEPEERSSLEGELGDRYEIQRMLGKGACGKVYKGFDREKKLEVALKRMHYYDVDVNGIPPHVLREVTALRSLTNAVSNNNIIRSFCSSCLYCMLLSVPLIVRAACIYTCTYTSYVHCLSTPPN